MILVGHSKAIEAGVPIFWQQTTVNFNGVSHTTVSIPFFYIL